MTDAELFFAAERPVALAADADTLFFLCADSDIKPPLPRNRLGATSIEIATPEWLLEGLDLPYRLLLHEDAVIILEHHRVVRFERGSRNTVELARDQGEVKGFALCGDFVVWTAVAGEFGAGQHRVIRRVPVAGGDVETIVADNAVDPRALVVTGEKLVWADWYRDRLMTCGIDGEGLRTLHEAVSDSVVCACGDEVIFSATDSASDNFSLTRYDRTARLRAPDLDPPEAIAADDDRVFFSTYPSFGTTGEEKVPGRLYEISRSGGEPRLILEDGRHMTNLLRAGPYLFWTAQHHNRLMKVILNPDLATNRVRVPRLASGIFRLRVSASQ